MSKKIKTDKLLLLEKLVQSSSDGEITTEQRDLFVNLVKETSPKSPKMRKKSANTPERQSRQRIKVVRNNSLEVEDKNHGKVQILLPQSETRSRSGSSRSRSGSSSSFWSSGSQDRGRRRKTSSRSRSSSRSSYSSRSRSRSRSRSSSSASSSSRSRSRSSSVEYSKNKVKERSKSPQTPLSPVKEQWHGSVSSTQSAPLTSTVNRRIKTNVDTASDSGRGKRKKLLKRSQIKKSRSLDMNPDVFIEERIKQKYKELNKLLSSQFTGSQMQVTQHQYQQMQNLRTQYVSASHGLPPSGVLVPRSLPHDLRVKRGAPQGLTQKHRRSRSRDTLTSDLGEDKTFVSVQRVLNTNAAREGKIIVDPHPVSTKKRKAKKTGSNTKLNSTFDSASENTGSRTLSPRSRLNVPELHHIKESQNPDLLKWLKQKDKEHRIKQKEERKKRREEREKLVLEANEKFERRLESQKEVEKWRSQKEKEYRKTMKQKRKEEKEIEMYEKRKMEMSVPGNSITVRPQTAPPEWKQKPQTNTYKSSKPKTTKDQKNNKEIDTGGKALTVQDQLGTSSEHLKFDLNDKNNRDPLPTTSKFMYKRPVAGKIKLNMKNRPMSAQPKLQTSHREQSEQLARDEQKENVRMSYDDWINTKKKHDIEKRKQEKIRQKEQLSKSDPEIEKIVPDIAKKRIHTIMNERKSIDTGIKRYDAATNRSFGGGNFEGGNSPKTSARTHAYKLDERPSTSKGRTTDTLKVEGSSSQRPRTAPARGRKVPVPMPMRSPYSPVPAHVPARVEEVMKSDDQSNPFKLPFPPEEGVPKHVASRQRKIFSSEFHSKDESREQQSEDMSMAVVPASSAVVVKTSSTEDIKYDNISTKDISNDVNTDEKNDYRSLDNSTTNGDTEESHNYKRGNDLQKEDEKITEEEHVESQENVENKDDKQNDKYWEIAESILDTNNQQGEESEKNSVEKNVSETENLVNGHAENSDTILENRPGGYDEVDTSLSEQKTNDDEINTVQTEKKTNTEEDSNHKDEKNSEEVKDDDSGENGLSQSLSKHVSFCEEPEVFVDENPREWSTDTGTPDEDNSRYTTKEDLSMLIDKCGELLNKEYGDQKDGENTFVSESLDDDF